MEKNTNRMEDMNIEAMRENILARYGEGGSENIVNDGQDGVAPAEVPEGTSAENDGADGSAVTDVGADGTAVQSDEDTGTANTPPTAQGVSYEAAMQAAQLRDENAALRQQLAETQAMAAQNAKAANQNVAEQVSGNAGMPSLDVDALLYADEAERQRIVSDYNRNLIEIAAKQATADMLGKISPLIKQYDTAVAKEQMDSAMNELAALDGFGDVRDHSDRIRQISERPEFANMPMSQRMTLAALVEKGMRASAPAPVAPDINTQVNEILANPELMKALAQRQATDVKQKNDGIPAHTAGGSFGNAAFVRPEAAKNFDEVRAKYGAF